MISHDLAKGALSMKIIYLLTVIILVSSVYGETISGPKAIYGKDNRSFVRNKKSQIELSNISKSIALIVSKDNVEEKFFTSLIKADLINDKSGLNLCIDQRFSGHHSVMSCTGFLVSKNILATAGHCFMSNYDCEAKKIIFHVLDSNEVNNGYKVAHQNVFNCKRIIKTELDSTGEKDFALIELDREVMGADPLKLSKKMIDLNTDVFMIGHPLGLPQVITTSAKVIDTSSPTQFKTTLDSFAGNSGSPVFNASTFEVEGVLVAGQEDFDTSENGCLKYKTFSEIFDGSSSSLGESVSRISEMFPFIK